MSRHNKSKAPAGKPKPAPAAKWRLFAWLLPLLLAVGAASWFAYGRLAGSVAIPEQPKHSDPAVAAQIHQAFEDVRKSPRSGSTWGKLGMVLHAYLFDEEARVCFSNAQRFERSQPRWPYFEGMLLLNSDPEAGLLRLARAVELCPSNPDTPRLQYARALLEHGRLPQAEAQFKELLARNPSHAPALLGLARISDARGEWQAATELLRQCLESPFAAQNAYLLLASVQAKANNAQAAQTANQIAAKLPRDKSWPEPYTDEVRSLQSGSHQLIAEAERALKENRHEDAERSLARLKEDYATSARTWLLAGRLRLERKDCLGAEEAFRRHLQINPQSVNGHSQLGLALLCQERYDEAVPVFERAVELKPDFGEAHFNLGFALARARRAPEALPALRNAIRYSPNFLEPYIILADLLGQMGDGADAMALLEQAAAIAPNDPRLSVLRERIARSQ